MLRKRCVITSDYEKVNGYAPEKGACAPCVQQVNGYAPEYDRVLTDFIHYYARLGTKRYQKELSQPLQLLTNSHGILNGYAPEYVDWSSELDSASCYDDGMGFAQEMLIHKSRIVEHTRPDSIINLYRALCNINEGLCLLETINVMRFGTFIDKLIRVGVSEALYMDMGGWKQSWYREYYEEEPQIIYPATNDCGTNWFTVYIND